MSNKQAQIGADPELFVMRKDGTSLPIFGLVGGTKEEPMPLFPGNDKLKGFAYQEDGAALEFNVPPTGRYDQFVGNIDAAMEALKTQLLAPKGLRIVNARDISLTREHLQHPLAQSIGCLPDHYAYDEKLPNYRRTPFEAVELGNRRYAGGHIHVAYNKAAVPPNIFAQYMDVFVGLSTVNLDKQEGRRKFYGLPGLYREKPYGIEYRTLSNFWLFQGNDYMYRLSNAVLRLAGGTYQEDFVEDTLQHLYPRIPWKDVHNAIANEDEKLVKMLHAWFGSDAGRLDLPF